MNTPITYVIFFEGYLALAGKEVENNIRGRLWNYILGRFWSTNLWQSAEP